MQNASTFDARALRLRVLDKIGTGTWKTPQEIAEELGEAYYTVSAMMSKMYLYGGPLERQRDPRKSSRYLYRRKTIEEHRTGPSRPSIAVFTT